MKTLKKMVEMGFTKELFPAGTHMCLIYADENERRKIVGKFLKSGIIGKEKVLYIADIMKPEEVREWLLNLEIELPKENGFSILDAEKTYYPNGEFIPENMFHTLRAFYEQAKKESYPSARVCGEASWVLKGIPGSERFMEYEALVNEVLLTHPVTAMCIYNANIFSGATILDVLKFHQMMIVHGQVVQNPYYMKPKDFLNR